MSRLHCQFHNAPAIFAGDLLDEVFQPIMDRTEQYLASRLGAELRPRWDQSQRCWVGCSSHHCLTRPRAFAGDRQQRGGYHFAGRGPYPAMEPTSQVCQTFRPTSSFVQNVDASGQTARFSFLGTRAPLPANARLRTTRSKRREQYASGSTRSCFYRQSFALKHVHDSVGQVLALFSYGGAKTWKWKAGHAQRHAWAHDQLVSPHHWSSRLRSACTWLFIPCMNHRG
jgi:hypothetical protein